MEQTFNERHAREILKPCNIDAYIKIDEHGVWPKTEYDSTEEPDLFLWSPAQVFRGELNAPEEASTPMLKVPFTARDLAAFMTEGVGALVSGFYGDYENGPDPARLKEIDPRSHARIALVQAYAARCEAEHVVGACPLALEVEAKLAREARRVANKAANIREGLSDSIPGTDDSRDRRVRAVASIFQQDAEMEATAKKWKDGCEKWLNDMVRQLLQPASKQNKTPAPVALVEAASDDRTPLPMNQIANCFAEFHGWNVAKWKAALGSPDMWLKDCRQATGTRGRGGFESTWWPLKIAAALIKMDGNSERSLRSLFKRSKPLEPWSEQFQINYPIDTDSL